MPIHKGLVVGKDFRPPRGADPMQWCYLVVDVSDDQLVSVRVHSRMVDTANVGDRVVFNRPRSPKRKVRYLKRR